MLVTTNFLALSKRKISGLQAFL